MKYFSIWPDCWLHCKIIHILCCTLVNFIMCSFFFVSEFSQSWSTNWFCRPPFKPAWSWTGLAYINIANKQMNKFKLKSEQIYVTEKSVSGKLLYEENLVLSSHQEESCGCSFRYWFHFNKQFGLYFVISKLLRSCNWCINKIYHTHSSFCNNFPWETLL